MPKLFSDTVINEVLDRSNIVDLVSSYLPLKRAGRNHRACCPFHPEKTASFIVSADKQIFHCFGCGVGGNALTFVMQYEKVNFREALEILAQRSGIPLPEPEKSDFQKSKEDFSKNIFSLYDKACVFYHSNLMVSPEAQAARAYLQKRGISKETAQHFKLGYCMPGWDTLIQYLKAHKASLALIEKSGLVVTKDEGGYYDRFRNRIIFPISDTKDRVVGFGARVLDNSLPKYINSPETAIYTKGKNLFGLNLARDFIRNLDQVIVVEGYLDMIVPFESGIKNIVASLGTALTGDQIKLIRRFTSNVVMLYDSDLAGELATLRALELLIKEDMNVRIAILPKGDDPDSFARKHGQEDFLKMVACAKNIFDYKFDLLLSRYEVNTTTGKDKIVREILPTIKKFKNQTMRAEYIKRISEKLDLDLGALFKDLEDTSEDYEYTQEPDQNASTTAVEHYRLKEFPITERMLVKLMLEELHIVDKLKNVIEPSDFVEEKLRKIVKFIFDFFAKGQECKPNILMNYIDDEEAINLISELSALEIHDCPDKEKLIEDCVKRLKRDKILYLRHEIHKEILAAQKIGDDEAVNRLMRQLDNLNKEYNSLDKQGKNHLTRSLVHG
jgi:DNA primase